MSSWIADEFSNISFNDERLNKRFLKLATELADKPSLSINSASINWAASKAAYRFFDNGNIQASKILEPHFLSTAMRCSRYDRVIIAGDTSYIDYTSHKKTKNLGKTGKNQHSSINGICMHVGLCLSPKGLPLGLTYNYIWNRYETKTSEHDRTMTSIQLKESYRWLECIKHSRKLLPNKEIVVVYDREGDIHEVFESALDNDVDVVVRSQHDRKLEDELSLREAISLEKIRGKHKVDIPGSGGRKGRTAELDVRFRKVVLSACPSGQVTPRNMGRSDIELTVVDATELGGELSWTLLTTLPVETLKDAKEILNYYKMRWQVEIYFKTLKTGCTVEECCLGEGGKLVKYNALMSVVAWRLYWSSFISRIDETISCESAFLESEWKTAWLMLHRSYIKEGKMNKSDMPTSPPTLKEVVHWIAGLGGFLRRKGDGEPGVITFWRGWNRLKSGLEVYELLT